jgi:hypothetical protein
MSPQDVTYYLTAIQSGGHAFPAVVENELEDLGLIRQTDAPYAVLTAAGRQFLAHGPAVPDPARPAPIGHATCPHCGRHIRVTAFHRLTDHWPPHGVAPCEGSGARP